MKAIICPVSIDRVSVNIPRITALFVVLVLIIAVATQSYFIVGLLAVDFYLRGFQNGKYSLLGYLSGLIVKKMQLQGVLIDKAPKIFAARLGFVFTLTIFLFSLIGLNSAIVYLSAALTVFALLECAFNICVGCYIYSWFVLPWVLKKN